MQCLLWYCYWIFMFIQISCLIHSKLVSDRQIVRSFFKLLLHMIGKVYSWSTLKFQRCLWWHNMGGNISRLLDNHGSDELWTTKATMVLKVVLMRSQVIVLLPQFPLL
jgi:hypothetical protein